MHSSPGDLFGGLTLPARAFGLIVRTPKLLMLSLLSAAVTGFTLFAVGYEAWALAQRGADLAVGGDAGWQRAASMGLSAVLFVLLFIAGALTLPNLLLAPLQDPLSEATEAQCGDFAPSPFSPSLLLRGTLESVRHTVTRLGFMTLGLAVFFPLNFVPVAGNVLWLILSSAWSMFWLSVEHLSNPMARHLHPFGEVVRVGRQRLPLMMGFGAALYVLLWVPVLNFFLMPVAVVAGTLLYRGLLQAEAIPKSQ